MAEEKENTPQEKKKQIDYDALSWGLNAPVNPNQVLSNHLRLNSASDHHHRQVWAGRGQWASKPGLTLKPHPSVTVPAPSSLSPRAALASSS